MTNVEVKLSDVMWKKRVRTIQELHEKTGISRTVISGLLNDKKGSVRLETIAKLCSALDCEIGELIVIKN